MFLIEYLTTKEAPFTLKKSIQLLIVSYFLVLISSFVSNIFIKLIDMVLTNQLHIKSLLLNQKASHSRIFRYGYVNGVIMMCLMGPLIEEGLFRLWLSINKTHLAISISLLCYVAMGNKWPINFHSYQIYLELVVSGIVFFISYKALAFKNEIVIHFLRSKTTQIYCISILLFGLMHILNFKPIHYSLFYVYPIFVVPQMIMGYFLTNLRVKSGFVWAVLLHIMINTTSILLFL